MSSSNTGWEVDTEEGEEDEDHDDTLTVQTPGHTRLFCQLWLVRISEGSPRLFCLIGRFFFSCFSCLTVAPDWCAMAVADCTVQLYRSGVTGASPGECQTGWRMQSGDYFSQSLSRVELYSL